MLNICNHLFYLNSLNARVQECKSGLYFPVEADGVVLGSGLITA